MAQRGVVGSDVINCWELWCYLGGYGRIRFYVYIHVAWDLGSDDDDEDTHDD